VVLDSGELACRFAGGVTFTDPAHQREFERLRGARRREPEVELRPLASYDPTDPSMRGPRSSPPVSGVVISRST